MTIEVLGIDDLNDGYRVSIVEEIRRCLITKKGAIPMNPNYGSDLWKYRDRTLDSATRIGIINESFDAIEWAVKRVKPKRVDIIPLADGKWGLKIEVELRDGN